MAQLQIPLAQLKSVRYADGSVMYQAHTVHFGSAATWCKPYTLSMPPLPEGVASCVVQRLSSACTLGSAGELISAGSAASQATVYHGDTLSVSAVAADGYEDPVVSLSKTTVDDDVTVSVTAGAYNWLTPSSKTPLPMTVNSSGSFACEYQHCYVAATCSYEDCDGCYCDNGLACGESLTLCDDVDSGLKNASRLRVTVSSGRFSGYSNMDDCGCDGCYCTDGSDCHTNYTGLVYATISPQVVELNIGETVGLACSGSQTVNPTLKAEYVSSDNCIRLTVDGTLPSYNRTKRIVISKLEYKV